jgi:hypothetical protein
MNQWRNVVALPAQRAGQYQDVVQDGRLYRVLSCADEVGQINCIYSTMTWALLRPATADDIPKLVPMPDGSVAQVIKNGVYRDEVAHFNLYKVMAHLNGIDWLTLPAMTAMQPEAVKSNMWASIDDEIYMNYTAARAQPREPEQAHSPLSLADMTTIRKNEIARRSEEEMIVFEPAKAEHTVTVFMDVDCKHCAQLYKDMKQVNDLGIRVRLLGYPQTGPDTPSWNKTESIWCASDRRGALGKVFNKEPLPPASCGTEAVIWHYALAKQLGIVGSPIILDDRGEIVGGYDTPQHLLQALNAASAKH